MKNCATRKCCFLSDDLAVVEIINKQTSKDKVLMKLIRRLVLAALRFNVYFRVKHIHGRDTCASGISLNTDLNSAASPLLTASLAPATRTAYRKTWDLLIQSVPHAALPISNIDLANFIGILFSQNYSPSSIASHVSAMSYVHKIMDLPHPGHCFLVRKLLKGCQCNSRLPIMPDILKKILMPLNHTVSSSNLRTLLKSIFHLAFNAFLRLDEIAVRAPQYTNLVVQRSEVTLQSCGVQISAPARLF